MRKTYTPTNFSQVIRERIKRLTQLTSVKDYYIEFRKLVMQLPSMSNEEKLSLFITGLREDERNYVQLQECKDLVSAYEKADLYENFAEKKKSRVM